MSSAKLFLPILLGTTRKARESKHVAKWVFSKMAAREEILKEYINKAVAFFGVSAGPWGGTRVIEACVPMVRECARGR